MSQANVAVVRRLLDAWNRHDVGGILDGKLIRLEQLGARPEFPSALESAGLRG